MASVSLRRLIKKYGEVDAVAGIDLEIQDNEFIVLVGPSGCGKSTILRMIAGLEDMSSGEILLDGVVINDREPKDRDVAMVFQDYALYPHMSVYDNMAFGLQMRRYAKKEIDSRVNEAARILKISSLLDRKPRQMSGGQRQRVAMGRAIVRNPKVFLFDEPLSNLDAKLRVQMRTEIKRLHKKVQTTIVYVTHDQVEAMTMADRIVILRDGHIEQVGSPAEVYARPSTLFVASFIGSPSMNFIPCTIEPSQVGIGARLSDKVLLTLPAEMVETLPPSGSKLILGIRPEHITYSPDGNGRPGWMRPTIEIIEPLGADALVFFQIGNTEVVSRIAIDNVRPVGSIIPLGIDLAQIHFFDPTTEKRVVR